MRHMVIELPLIKQNGMIGMVQLDQMLQRAGWLLGRILDLVNFGRWNLEMRFLPEGEDARE